MLTALSAERIIDKPIFNYKLINNNGEQAMKLKGWAAVCCAVTIAAIGAPPAQAATPYLGTVQATFWIGLATPVPSGYDIQCQLIASTEDFTVGTSVIGGTFTDSAVVVATMSGTTSGSSGYCTVSLPYEWLLSNQATDTMSISYIISMLPSSGTTGSGSVTYRSTSGTAAASVAVPGERGVVTVGPISITL